ncbi:MAG: DUF2125 domain-containing protein [Pseudomonadota bacterium]
MKRLSKLLLGVAAGLAMGWALWWQVLASGQEVAIAAWFDARRAQGWQAEHSAVDVAGFPTRLEREIRNIALTDPKTGWSWSAPEVAFLGEAISPTVIRVNLPESHILSLPRETVEIGHSRMQADLSLSPDPALSWRRGAIDGADLNLAADSGWTGSARTLTAEIKARAKGSAPPNSYAINLSATEVAIPKPLLTQIDPTGLLAPLVNQLHLTGTAALQAPLDRYALEEGRLALNAATIRQAKLVWGDMRIEASGRIKTDLHGFASGEIDLKLRNWREMVRIARQSNTLDRRMLGAIEQALKVASVIGGTGQDVEVTLRLNGGKVRIGPIAIGKAPKLAPPA